MNDQAPPADWDDRGPSESAVRTSQRGQEILPPIANQAGQVTVASFGGIVMAQKVDQRRDLRAVEKEIMAVCADYGEGFVYSWEVTDRQTKKKATIEGVTVDGASVLRQIWRNNMCETIVFKDEGEFVIFASRFVDYETGNTVIRPFKQRTGMKFGRMQKDRVMETTFSIGVSKAERNVTLDALRIQKEQMLKYAKDNLRSKIDKNPAKSKARILEIAKEFEIPLEKLERYVERKEKDWVTSSMVRLVQAMRAIQEGDATVDDVFGQEVAEGDLGEEGGPKGEQQGTQQQGGQPTEQKAEAKAEGKPAAEKKPAAKKAEPKAEPAKEQAQAKAEPAKEAEKKPADPPAQQSPTQSMPADPPDEAEGEPPQGGFAWLATGDDADLGED